jgi:hypothetical protein
VTGASRLRLIGAGLLALAFGLSPLAAHAAAGTRPAGKPNPVADPAHNTAPSAAFMNACFDMGTSKAANVKCDKAARASFDKVRKGEGLAPMTLPKDFATLSVPSQLLAISDIERVDRHRRPVLGRSASLDKLAQQGANQDRDPSFPSPFTGSTGGANWAGAGNSALLDDFYWMYDDGPGSGNLDCQHKGDPGCWGHRHDIIDAYPARLVMGAAVAYKTNDGTSMTEEFIGGDTGDQVDVHPIWTRIAKTFPDRIAISASAPSVASGAALTISGHVSRAVVHTAVGSARVLLQRHLATGGWAKLGTARAGPHGVVHFHLHPTASRTYRLVVLSSSGSHVADSAALRVAVS